MEAFLITKDDCIGVVDSKELPRIGAIFTYCGKQFKIISKEKKRITATSCSYAERIYVLLREI